MIGGMWSDLRTDRNATDDVYMVQPDRDRVIFRWQGVTFGNETPVNFEIELRRDGTIKTRYGSGNQNLEPVVVGISGGDPASYLVPTHTSEVSAISLTNAQSVTFALRNPPPPPSSDLSVSVTANPNPVISSQNMTFHVNVTNLGPSDAEDMVMTDALPAGSSFCFLHFFAHLCDLHRPGCGQQRDCYRQNRDAESRATCFSNWFHYCGKRRGRGWNYDTEHGLSDELPFRP